MSKGIFKKLSKEDQLKMIRRIATESEVKVAAKHERSLQQRPIAYNGGHWAKRGRSKVARSFG